MLLHHATKSKAEKLGVRLTIEDNRVIAIDTKFHPDDELSDTDAKVLLERVLARRPNGEAGAVKPARATRARRAAEDGGEQEEEEEGEGEGEGEGEDGEQKEEEPEAGGTVVKPKYKQAYQEFDGTCGDAFADAFGVATRTETGTDLPAVHAIAHDNGIDPGKWAHLNPGLQRMNIGNVLRGKVRRGEAVQVGKQRFEPVLDADGKPTKEFKVNTSRGAVR